MLSSFHKKTILVTGASSDIGLEIAKSLMKLGATLILHASTTQSIEKVKSAIPGNEHKFWMCDFSDPINIESSWKDLQLNMQLSGAVHCVGMRSRRPLNMLKPQHITEVMNTNFNAYIELLRVLTNRKRYEQGFSIVSISSIAALSGGPGVTAYAASKAAMDAANRCLAKELYKKGIRLNSVICGQVETSAYNRLMESKESNVDPVLERQYMGLASTGEIKDIVLFLLSEKSKFLNGTSIHADGGYLS